MPMPKGHSAPRYRYNVVTFQGKPVTGFPDHAVSLAETWQLARQLGEGHKAIQVQYASKSKIRLCPACGRSL